MAERIMTVDKTERGLQKKMIRLLRDAGIRPDPFLDYSCALVDEDDEVLATGSLYRNTLRCLAVRPDREGEGLMGQIVSHLLQTEIARGYSNAFLCTKPENAEVMKDMGFHEIISVPGVLFMESRKEGFSKWLGETREAIGEECSGARAAIVMNANPFTLGHRHLVEQAAASFDRVIVFAVEEENGTIPFAVRLNLIREGLQDLPDVAVLPSGPYIISQATFPSYFLKDEEEAQKAYTSVDMAVFTRIAHALSISARFAGEEPESRITALYNDTMQEMLPREGIAFTVIPRLRVNGRLVSARTVRKALHDGDMETVRAMTPESTSGFFASEEGQEIINALRERS